MERNFKDLNNEAEILERARKLDESSLAILIKKYYSLIYRYFYYRVTTQEDIEDLINEVFLRMNSSIKTQKGDFMAWLFRIAKNLLIDYYRKKGRTKETSLDEISPKLPLVSNDDKGSRLYPDEIKKLFSFLTDEQKEMLQLKFIEGYSNGEIAEILNKSIGAIKLLQFRGLSTLRDILKKEG